MKGQEPITTIIIVGVLMSIAGSAYLWGAPLVQKNMDAMVLKNSENLMFKLKEEIINTARNGGKTSIEINVPGIMEYDDANQKITLTIESKGTIYSEGDKINLDASDDSYGTLGKDSPGYINVQSNKLSESSYETVYTLGFRKLQDGSQFYLIDLQGNKKYGGEKSAITFENKGTQPDLTTIKTEININIL